MRTSTEKFTQLAQIGAEFLALSQEPATLNAIVTKATEFVPGCDAAAIVRRERDGSPKVVASAGDFVSEPGPQVERGDGPTVSCLSTGKTSVVRVAQEARWPDWVAVAQEVGVTGVISVALAAGTERLGVLALHSYQPEGFDCDAVPIASAYCSYASVALFASRQTSGLTSAVEARHRIGIAQGILMCRYSISKDVAFQLLRRYSNATNTKLRDVADQVYELRDLPPVPKSSSGRLPYPRVPRQDDGRREG